MSATPPYAYIYEWDGSFGLHQSTSSARYNGMAPNRSVPVYIAPPTAEPIDMLLYCPNCGVQHIDKDNSDEIRIQAAELGIDREGDRRCERWIEEREWTNPPHRSHLCASCGCIWRPADVPTNGVDAIKTEGTADSWVAASPDAALALRNSSFGKLGPPAQAQDAVDADDPLQGAVDWLLQADGEFFCVATVQRTLRIGYNRANRLSEVAKERAAISAKKGGQA